MYSTRYSSVLCDTKIPTQNRALLRPTGVLDSWSLRDQLVG